MGMTFWIDPSLRANTGQMDISFIAFLFGLWDGEHSVKTPREREGGGTKSWDVAILVV